MNEVAQMLRLLGYDDRWIEYGFLSKDDLSSQYQSFLGSSDRNPEHYRYSTFRSVLSQRSSLTDCELGRYIELAASDVDAAMGGSALGDLLHWSGLAEEQVELVSALPVFQAGFLKRLVARRRLLNRLKSTDVSAELVEACVASHDGEVQRALLAKGRLLPGDLARLAIDGCNRAIRNLAKRHLTARSQDPPN